MYSIRHELLMHRRSFIAAALACALPTVWYGLASANLFHRGGGVPSSVSGANLATLTLVNTSGSTQAAQTVSPIFGWCFKDGDIAAGTAPVFNVSGVAQPYSWGCQVYWTSGCLKFAAFMARWTFTVAG